MDYYEEFGISPSASVEEIRQAHKRLARLFHPDRFQGNEDLRRVAEIQMKRVNHAFSVLDDVHQREAYDLQREVGGVDGVEASPHYLWWKLGQELSPVLRKNLIWVMAVMACVLAITWFFSTYSTGGKTLPALSSAPAALAGIPSPPLTPAKAGGHPRPENLVSGERYRALRAQNAGLQRQLRRLEEERNASLAEVMALRRKLENSRKAVAVAEVRPVAAPPPRRIRTPVAGAVPRATQARRKGFAGTWFYVPIRGDQVADLYPPEYIETVIVEEGSHLRGRYRGRYRVTDRPISPEVVFAFDGERNLEGRYWWTGGGGSSGEVRLTLVSEDLLKVEWFASELGTQLGLASGTALLVRQADP